MVKEPTKSETGEKQYLCEACGYIKVVELEWIAEEESTGIPRETDIDTEQVPSRDTESSFFTGYSLIWLGIGIVIGGGGVLGFLLSRKRK